MATTTLEFAASEGLTLTVELYAPGADALLYTASATEKINNEGNYSVSVVDVPTGTYRFRAADDNDTSVVIDFLDHRDTADILEFLRSEGRGPATVVTVTEPADVSALTIAERLETARDNFAAILVEISTNPKPSYTVNGQTFSWVEYQRFLLDAIKNLNDQIVALSDPYEIIHQGMT